MTSLRRAQRFVWEVEDAQADETERVPLGTALRSPSIPHAFDVNLLRVEEPSELPLDALAAAAPDHVPYRRLRVEDQPTAERLADAARTTPGWEVSWEVVMLLERPDAHAAATRGRPARPVREGSLDEVLRLMRAWYDADGFVGAERDDCMVMAERGHRATDERRFVADHGGRPGAMCVLRRRTHGVAVLESAFVLPGARGQGLGAAVMHAALGAAIDEGHEVLALLADEADWPREVYVRLGFGVATRRAILHRTG